MTKRSTISTGDRTAATALRLLDELRARRIPATSVSVGSVQITMTATYFSASDTAIDRAQDGAPQSMYAAFGGDLVDDAVKRAHGDMSGGQDLVPVVTG